MSAYKRAHGKRHLGPQVGGEGKGAPGERSLGSPGKKGRQGALPRELSKDTKALGGGRQTAGGSSWNRSNRSKDGNKSC